MALASCERTRVISQPAIAAKAKRIIWLYMAGGISQFETFDYKPLLEKLDGQPMPESITKGQQLGAAAGAQTERHGAPARVSEVGRLGPVDRRDPARAGIEMRR